MVIASMSMPEISRVGISACGDGNNNPLPDNQLVGRLVSLPVESTGLSEEERPHE